jgi:hypothetical protein
VIWSIAAVAVVVSVVVIVVGMLAERSTQQTLVGSTWNLASYDYLVYDGRAGDHPSDTVAIAHPERYSLIFDEDGTAVLTADCYRSTWDYAVDYRIGNGLLFRPPATRFALQQDAELVPGCEPAADVALDVTGGTAAESFKVFLARTWGLEFRSGALVLFRPMEHDPFTGTYPNSRPLEQVFHATPRQ